MSRRIRQTIPEFPPAEARTWGLVSWELDGDGSFPSPDHSWALQEPDHPPPRLRRLTVRVCPRCGLGRTRVASHAVYRCRDCGAISVRWKQAARLEPEPESELELPILEPE